MIIMKILFAALIIICGIFYIMYLGDFALVLFIVMLALPVVMYIFGYAAKKKIRVSFSLKENSVIKNQEFPIKLDIENSSIFPVGKAEAVIEYYNVFNNQIHSFRVLFPVQAKNRQSVSFMISSQFCGIVKIRCAYVNIFDPLRIFRFKTGKNTGTEIAVIPEGHDITGTVSYSDRVNEESNNFSDVKPGDDPSEVFDLRGYNPGDKLNRIHWKLSSKKDEFIVKEYSLPVDVPSVIFLNLRCYEDSEHTLPVFDTLMETFISISKFMLENERVHTLIYFNENQGVFTERVISSTNELSETVSELIFSISDNLYCEPPEVYFSENSNLSFSSFTFVTSRPDTDILTYIDENVDADFKNSAVIVKNYDEEAKTANRYSSMREIPVAVGRISNSIKDIEL
ncbi:MAG: DUF58 domain-containing protein [Ruminococcus sp.]|nr:DUF58 domain-containing protein [Ruminococcus sp.]